MSDERETQVTQDQVGPMGEHRTVIATLQDVTANPGPLGLMAFGMTTVLLNFHNAGFFALNSMIIGMGIFYGGLAQVIAGIMEWKKNSTFGMTAFLSYGLFWMTLVALWVFETIWPDEFTTDGTAAGWYLFAWGVFTGLMFVGALRINRALQTVFGTLTVLFVLLAIGKWVGEGTFLGIAGADWTKIAGYEGIVTGLSAVYASIAQIWNEVYGRVVLPIGVVKK
jgi:succinate-acetate transporter protein